MLVYFSERNGIPPHKSVFSFSWVVENELPKDFSFTLEQNVRSFLFCKMVLKGIPSILFFAEWFWTKLREVPSFFSSTKRFRTEFRVFLAFAEWFQTKWQSVFLLYEMFGTEFSVFSYLPRNALEQNSERCPFLETGGILMEWIKTGSMFRGIFFFSKNGNPSTEILYSR